MTCFSFPVTVDTNKEVGTWNGLEEFSDIYKQKSQFELSSQSLYGLKCRNGTTALWQAGRQRHNRMKSDRQTAVTTELLWDTMENKWNAFLWEVLGKKRLKNYL